jgi:hypothetical protein
MGKGQSYNNQDVDNSKEHQKCNKAKVSIKVIRTLKVKIDKSFESLPMGYYLWIPRPVEG